MLRASLYTRIRDLFGFPLFLYKPTMLLHGMAVTKYRIIQLAFWGDDLCEK